MSRLAAHADVMLVLLSPLYFIWPHAKTLLLTQSVVLALGAIFVYLIAKDVFKNKNWALLFGFLYLMTPAMQWVNLYDFHAVALATTLLLGTFYFLIKRKYYLMCLFIVLAGTTKEQVWVITSFFGLPLTFKKQMKTKILGAGIIFFSLLIFVSLVWKIIPQNSGSEHFALSYYSEFGDSPTQIVSNVLLSPQKTLPAFFEKDRTDYIKQLLMPFGFSSFLAPLFLVFATPELLITLLSNNPQLRQIYYQYSSTITPFVVISAIYGTRQFIKWFPKVPQVLITSYLLFFMLYSAYNFGPLPGAKKSNLAMFTNPQKNKDVIDNFLSKIPEQYIVAATNNLGSHLSQRQIIYTLPMGIEKADVILFLLDDSAWQPGSTPQREALNNVEANMNYEEVLRYDNFAVFKKKDIAL